MVREHGADPDPPRLFHALSSRHPTASELIATARGYGERAPQLPPPPTLDDVHAANRRRRAGMAAATGIAVVAAVAWATYVSSRGGNDGAQPTVAPAHAGSAPSVVPVVHFPAIGPTRPPASGWWPGVIAYAADDASHGYLSGANAIFVTTAGRRPHRIFMGRHGQVGSIAFSPDGKRIAFTYDDPLVHPEAYTLWVIAADGGHLQHVVSRRWDYSSITWSPDGRWIAGSAVRSIWADRPAHLLLVPARGGAVRDLTPAGRSAWTPAWVPGHHDRLAFAAAEGGQNESTGELDIVHVPDGHLLATIPNVGSLDPVWLPGTNAYAFDNTINLYLGESPSRITMLVRCPVSADCEALRPLTVLPDRSTLAFEAVFGDTYGRPPEIETVVIGTNAFRRVLSEPPSGCCAAWWLPPASATQGAITA
jgi:hypothetical protein